MTVMKSESENKAHQSTFSFGISNFLSFSICVFGMCLECEVNGWVDGWMNEETTSICIFICTEH